MNSTTPEIDAKRSERDATDLRFLALLLIVILGAVLRFWGTGFGLPGQYRPDEEYLINSARRPLAGEFDPGFVLYPSLYIYCLSAVFALFRFFGEMIGLFPKGGFDTFLSPYYDSALYLIGRLTNAAIGTITILATYRFGSKLFGKESGVLAALILACNFVHLREAHYATTDTLMTLLVVLALSAMTSVARRGLTRDYVLAGILAGLAISAKYTAASLAIPYFVAHGVRLLRERRMPWDLVSVFQCLLGGGLVLLAFAATSPYVLLNWEQVQADFNYQRPFIVEGLPGVPMDFGIRWVVNFAYLYGVGILTMLLSIYGALFSLSRGTPEKGRDFSPLIPISFIIAVSIVFTTSRWVFFRYIDPTAPLFAVLAGYGALVLGRSLAPRFATAIGIVVTVVACIAPLKQAVAFNRVVEKADSREIFRSWLSQHLHSPEKIVIHSDFYYGKPGPHADRYVLWTNFPKESRRDPFLLVVDEHPAPFFCPVPQDEIQTLITERGKLLIEIEPFSANADKIPQVYDQQDAFYAPISGFDAVRFPGPRLKLYRIFPTQ